MAQDLSIFVSSHIAVHGESQTAGRLFEGLAVWVPLRFAPPEVTPGREWQQVELCFFRQCVWIL